MSTQNRKTSANLQEMDQFMMLHNYIDKYQERLGLNLKGTK